MPGQPKGGCYLVDVADKSHLVFPGDYELFSVVFLNFATDGERLFLAVRVQQPAPARSFATHRQTEPPRAEPLDNAEAHVPRLRSARSCRRHQRETGHLGPRNEMRNAPQQSPTPPNMTPP